MIDDREPRHARILNAWIDDQDSDILRTRYQENEKRFLQKYNNLRFLDDEDNKNDMIASENLDFKGPTRRNNQYSVVGQTLNLRDGDNVELIISRYFNDDVMVLIKGSKKDPDLGLNIFHPSIDDDRQATDSDKEENDDNNTPEKPYDGQKTNASSDYEVNNDEDPPHNTYDGENMNDYSNNEENIDEVSPKPPTDDKNINANSDDEKNDYEVTPHTPTNGGNNETIDNNEGNDKNMKLRRKYRMKNLI